jgi:predicted phosphodiesterase
MKIKTDNNIERLISHLKEYGKTDSWVNLANEFKVFQGQHNKSKSDNVRYLYRKHVRVAEEAPKQALKLKSRWQSASGEWLESYKADESLDVAQEFDRFKNELLSDIASIKNKPYSNTIKKGGQGSCLVELALPDFHFGKIDGLSIIEQAILFKQTVLNLIYKADAGVDIERIVFPLGNDLFNSDNLNYTTVKGTQQRDNSHWQESFRVAWTTIIEVINDISKVAPVDVIMVAGNHDESKVFYLGDLLKAYYSNAKSITIDNEINAPRKYYQYKDTLIGYTHGDKEKLHELPLIMATEVPEAWATSIHRSFHTGHLHKQEVTEYQGVVVRIMPSLTGRDEWHKQMGYNSIRRAQVLIWGDEGLEGYFQKSYY